MKNRSKSKISHKRLTPENQIKAYIDRLYRECRFFEESGKFEKAIRLYDRILEMSPNDQNALLWKNQLINLQGKHEGMYT